MREERFLHIVDRALTAPSLWMVQDLVGRGVEPTEKVVEFQITLAQFGAAAVGMSPPSAARGEA